MIPHLAPDGLDLALAQTMSQARVSSIGPVDTLDLHPYAEATFRLHRHQASGSNMQDITGHRRIEERSIALHRKISDLLEKNPQLLDVARRNLKNGVEVHGELPVFREWAIILDCPIEEIRTILINPSEKARWLRQSSPFSGILEPRERWKIYEAFST
jgi:hypothetical protein